MHAIQRKKCQKLQNLKKYYIHKLLYKSYLEWKHKHNLHMAQQVHTAKNHASGLLSVAMDRFSSDSNVII